MYGARQNQGSGFIHCRKCQPCSMHVVQESCRNARSINLFVCAMAKELSSLHDKTEARLDYLEQCCHGKIRVENKKYDDKITPIQQRFIDHYTTRYGQWSATHCAIAAGYSKSSAHVRAAELLDWKKHPDIAIEIQDRLAALREAWDVNRDKHLAMLTRIRDAALEKGNLGVANKSEELRGKVAGLYVERNLNITKELTSDELTDKMKDLFPSKEVFIQENQRLMKELFPDDED